MTTLLAPGAVGVPDEPTPIDVWLLRQQDLTAVERFAAYHDGDATTARWQDRLPATGPGPGQQYGFEVDLDSCTGCKACVAACHSLNGLDDGEAWRRVGSLHDASDEPGSVTVTSACHHCVDPACMKGCPAKAYEKDPVTGIVRHLDDACIGCSYCTLTCPYEVPVFNQSLGIVRKCDLCSDRLAEGEAPACVQGCPQGAITIAVVAVEELLARTRGPAADPVAALVPTAPRSKLTVPTTAYVSSTPLPGTWVAADESSIHPSHGHTPLAVMLVLTQAAVGMTLAASWLRVAGGLDATATRALATMGLGTALVALAASTLHLGRPLLAWRAILGLRQSWLSREILAFGTFAGAGVALSGLDALDAPALLTTGAESAMIAGGVAGVACSVRLYAVTGRRWWRTITSGIRFVGTTAVCGGVATAAVVASVDPASARPAVSALLPIALVGLAASVLAPLLPLRRAGRRRPLDRELATTRRLLGHQLQGRLVARLVAAFVGLCFVAAAGIALPSLDDGARGAAVALALACFPLCIGEYLDRRLFFLASVAPRMPGSPR
ncbi:DmsC/YnfH family molybdoenzyme membrane anchor subunit [Aquihabitans daechungensis]|uniref:DmsC/YnfH family molybdoenzyme membrane anchor subunit n=1 Tax=Aquihabitans daechungensis TaxID=1052257 RepID=UPI003BA38A23